jgi:hypothetical protein
MAEEIRQFVLTSLKEMNYDVSDVTGTPIWDRPVSTLSHLPSPSWPRSSRTGSE